MDRVRPRLHPKLAVRTIWPIVALALSAAIYVFVHGAGASEATSPTGPYGGMQVHYVGTNAAGVANYVIQAPDDGPGAQRIRVLRPTRPAHGVPHNFLFVLPVQAGVEATYGDGLKTLEKLDAQNRYNLTIVEPTFGIDPWYADVPDSRDLEQESFMTDELVPWVKAKLATTGSEQNWLIGFSKSGVGGQDLLLKHPNVFTLAASWDFPANMSRYDEYGAASAYDTQTNFGSQYELTRSFIHAHSRPFRKQNRIWIGGYSVFGTDVADYDMLLTQAGIKHTMGPSKYVAHRWDSGWIPAALVALHEDSQKLRAVPRARHDHTTDRVAV
jgi:Putative esterase